MSREKTKQELFDEFLHLVSAGVSATEAEDELLVLDAEQEIPIEAQTMMAALSFFKLDRYNFFTKDQKILLDWFLEYNDFNERNKFAPIARILLLFSLLGFFPEFPLFCVSVIPFIFILSFLLSTPYKYDVFIPDFGWKKREALRFRGYVREQIEILGLDKTMDYDEKKFLELLKQKLEIHLWDRENSKEKKRRKQ